MEVNKTLCKSVHSKEIEVRYNLYLHSNYDAEMCTALGSAISIKKILSSRMSKLQNVMLQVIQNNVAQYTETQSMSKRTLKNVSIFHTL